MTGKKVRSKACVLMSPHLDQTNGQCQIKSTLIPQVSRNSKEVCHILILAWSSFHLSVLLAWNWSVRFTLIRLLWKVLQSVDYNTIKNQSKSEAMYLLHPTRTSMLSNNILTLETIRFHHSSLLSCQLLRELESSSWLMCPFSTSNWLSTVWILKEHK